jgi:pimeloyl-ACP methyl ester carboxylesterase
MARVVMVHGIGNQYAGANTLHAAWLPAMLDGLELAGWRDFHGHDLACAFYGDVFRAGSAKGLGPAPLTVEDLEADERALAIAWAEGAVGRGSAGAVKARAPLAVQHALNRLLRSKAFAGVTERVLIADLKQVSCYFRAPTIRATIIQRVRDVIDDETQVVVGHSLGSVIAYEVLAAEGGCSAATLVTLGSPLAIRNLIFDRIQPAPTHGRGHWPSGLRAWFNVADRSDPVALEKRLDPFFAGTIEDHAIHNGAHAHDARPYLTAQETGAAIAAGLTSAA